MICTRRVILEQASTFEIELVFTVRIIACYNKKKHAVASCPRVSTSHFNKTTVCYVATLSGIPNHERGRHNDYARTLDQPTFKFF